MKPTLEPMAKDWVKVMMRDYRLRSIKKGRAFELGYAEFKALASGQCVYCGDDPKTRTINEYNGVTKTVESYQANGIDRVDNTKGYEIGNCVSCCSTCNMMKMQMSDLGFLSHVRKIVKFKEK